MYICSRRHTLHRKRIDHLIVAHLRSRLIKFHRSLQLNNNHNSKKVKNFFIFLLLNEKNCLIPHRTDCESDNNNGDKNLRDFQKKKFFNPPISYVYALCNDEFVDEERDMCVYYALYVPLFGF